MSDDQQSSFQSAPDEPSTPTPLPAREGQLAAPDSSLSVLSDGPSTSEYSDIGNGAGRSAARGLSEETMTPARLAWRELKKNRLAVIGGWTLLVLYTLALLAQFIAPYDPQDQVPARQPSATFHPPMRLRFREADTGNFHSRPFVYGSVQRFTELRDITYPLDASKKFPIRFFVRGEPFKLLGFIPCRTHLFGTDEGGRIFLLGTDEYGRDYFSRLLYGSQISLSVGLLAIAISFSLGLLVGGISGFYGGVIDDLIMRVCEIIMSVPSFYLLLALSAALPVTLSPVMVYVLIIAILSFVGWAGMARVVRGMVLSVREREYVEAGRSLGLRDVPLIIRHILPATFTYAIVSATMAVPGYILGEAGLSFLGLGIRDPMASWGNMLSAAQNLTTLQSRAWILAPGIMIFITTLAFNFLGDGLRDALDPKSRRLG